MPLPRAHGEPLRRHIDAGWSCTGGSFDSAAPHALETYRQVPHAAADRCFARRQRKTSIRMLHVGEPAR